MFLDEKETRLAINGQAGELEVVVTMGDPFGILASKTQLVIICHPHPLHGGTMDNKVVTTLVRTYRDLGIHVVRFNFRGVGKSQGVFDNAVGELEDLMAVIDWANGNLNYSALLLAGFSFGSSIAAQASHKVAAVVHLTLVAPPVERYVYDCDGTFTSPVCVVQGDKDERVNANGVYAWATALKSPAVLIRYSEAGHFFHGFLSALKKDLTEKLITQL